MRLRPRDSRPHEEGQCQHQRARAKIQLRSRTFANRSAVLIRVFAAIRNHSVSLPAGLDGFAGIAVTTWAAARTVRAAGIDVTGEGD